MNIYKWTIKPLSSFITPFDSDTLYGYILWAIKYTESEEFFQDTLNNFKNYNPPFIVSNGFTENKFPLLNTKTINRSNSNYFQKISQDHNKPLNSTELIRTLKKIKKNKFVNLKLFNEMLNGYDNLKLIEEIIKVERNPFNFEKFEIIPKVKNSLNRITNSTDGENSLYNQEEKYYNSNISIFFKCNEEFSKKLEIYLNIIEKFGYGKKASSGLGYFETISFEKYDNFKEPENPNAFITLSNYIAKEEDFENIISSDIKTKRGKLGGEYAFHELPFKKPFVYYTPGSIFKTNDINNIKGRVLDNIHYDSKFIQIGIPFILGVKINEI
jgi:CRISPR type III-A-associated RAMP protein Csm4